MFGKKKNQEGGQPQQTESKAKPEGKQKISKGFGNTIILFIVFFIVFTVIVTGVAFFADKIDLSGSKEKNLEDIAPAEKMTDPKQGEETEYVMNEKGDVAKKEVMEPMMEKPAEPEQKIPMAAGVEKPAPKPAPLPPVNIKPEIQKQPEPKKQEAKKPAPPKPAPSGSLTSQSTTGDFVVQLASFQHKSYADAEMKQLKKLIPSVFVVKADLGDKGVWYRLRCFNGVSYQEAKDKAALIASKTSYKPYPMKK